MPAKNRLLKMPKLFRVKPVTTKPATAKPKKINFGEETLLQHLRAMKLPTPEREFLFHPTRKFRFDFAWPDLRIAAEVEGGIWSGGRHTRGQGYTDDCFKYNEALFQGWQVYRFTTDMVKKGDAISMLEKILK